MGAEKTTTAQHGFLHSTHSKAHKAPTGSTGARASPQAPHAPVFLPQYLASVGSPAALRAAHPQGSQCPERKFWARHRTHFGGSRLGLSLLLPSRKAMGLPQWFRERPFPDSTSLRKLIPGREPRAGSALPAPSSASMGRVHLHMGEPLSAQPHAHGRPSQLPQPTAEGRSRHLPPHASIHLFCHAQGNSSIHSLSHLQRIPLHPSSSQLMHSRRPLPPLPLFTWEIPPCLCPSFTSKYIVWKRSPNYFPSLGPSLLPLQSLQRRLHHITPEGWLGEEVSLPHSLMPHTALKLPAQGKLHVATPPFSAGPAACRVPAPRNTPLCLPGHPASCSSTQPRDTWFLLNRGTTKRMEWCGGHPWAE